MGPRRADYANEGILYASLSRTRRGPPASAARAVRLGRCRRGAALRSDGKKYRRGGLLMRGLFHRDWEEGRGHHHQRAVPALSNGARAVPGSRSGEEANKPMPCNRGVTMPLKLWKVLWIRPRK